MPGDPSFFLRKRALSCLSSLVLVIAVMNCNPSAKIKVMEERQGSPIFSNYTFAYEDAAQSKVAQLFKEEKLERFIHEYKTQWERHVALCDWTNAQFPPGKPDPYPLSNGLDILKDIRAGKTKGFCGQYAYLLGDASKALGYFQVRYVELESKDQRFHFNLEVWNDDWQKWVVLDPFYNVYYTGNDGVPLSALQLHDLYLQGKRDAVKIHRIQKRDYQPDAEASIDFYQSIAIGLRNDLAGLTMPVTVQDRLRTFLQYRDPQVKNWKSVLAYLQVSSRKEDFDYPCNQVWIRYEVDPADNSIQCRFETRGTIPHFRRFLVSIDQDGWMETGTEFDWKPGEGEHTLQVSGTNQFLLSSRPAILRVKVE